MSKKERLHLIEEARDAGLSYFERTIYASVSSVFGKQETSIIISDQEIPPLEDPKNFNWWYANFRETVARMPQRYRDLLKLVQGDPARFLSLASLGEGDVEQFVRAVTHRGNVEVADVE